MRVGKDEARKRLYAFVLLDNATGANDALKEMNNITIEDTQEKLYVNFMQSKQSRKKELQKQSAKTNETNLFIRSLLHFVSEEKVKEVFGKYGPISSCALKEKDIPAGSSTVKAKYGFINFEKAQDAKDAFSKCKSDQEILDLLNTEISNHKEFIFYHESRDERLKAKEQKKSAVGEAFANLGMNDEQAKRMMEMFKIFMKTQKGGAGISTSPTLIGANKPAFNQGGFPKPQVPAGGKPNLINNILPGSQRMPTMPMGLPGMPRQPGMPQGMMAPNMMFPGMMQNPLMMPNQMMMMQPMAQVPASVPARLSVDWIQNNMAQFMSFTDDRKKKELGSLLYPLVEKETGAVPRLTPKITGMLIDFEVLSVDEILQLIRDPVELRTRIEEAMELIKQENAGAN